MIADCSSWNGTESTTTGDPQSVYDDTSGDEFYTHTREIFYRIATELHDFVIMVENAILAEWPEMGDLFPLVVCIVLEFPRWPPKCVTYLPRPPPLVFMYGRLAAFADIERTGLFRGIAGRFFLLPG